MGAATLRSVQCYCSFLALLLCSQFLRPSQAFKVRTVAHCMSGPRVASSSSSSFMHASVQAVNENVALICGGNVRAQLRGGYDQEKVPLAVIVPDPSPELSPLSAPPPMSGADGDMRPRLPTERWRRGRGEERRGAHAPAPAAAALAPSARAPALAPDSGSGTAFIRSSPAVPVPRGVTDTATILPMPAPGDKRQVLPGRAPDTPHSQQHMHLFVFTSLSSSFSFPSLWWYLTSFCKQ